MSLYGPTFHATHIDLYIKFQCKIYVYFESCIVEKKLHNLTDGVVVNMPVLTDVVLVNMPVLTDGVVVK